MTRKESSDGNTNMIHRPPFPRITISHRRRQVVRQRVTTSRTNNIIIKHRQSELERGYTALTLPIT